MSWEEPDQWLRFPYDSIHFIFGSYHDQLILQVQTLVAQASQLVLVPIQFAVALSLLIWTVGPSGFGGLATTLLLIPLGKSLVAKLKGIRRQALKCTDEVRRPLRPFWRPF
jgi:hypothetical protein